MLVSILTAICGIILIFYPFKSATAVVTIIVYGILDIISTLFIKKNYQELTKPSKKKDKKAKEGVIVKEEEGDKKDE